MAKDLPAPRGTPDPKRHGRRLRAFLFLTYGLLTTFPLVVLSVVGAEIYLREQHAAPRQRLLSSARALALATDAFLGEHRRRIALTARALETVVPDDAEARDMWLARANHSSSGFRALVLADRTGRIVAADPRFTLDGRRITEIDVSDRPFFRVPLETGSPYLSGALLGFAFGSDPIAVVSEPFRGADGRVLGVLGASLHLDRLAELVEPHLRVAGTEVVISDPEGTVVYASPGTGLEALGPRPSGPICGPARGKGRPPPLVGRATVPGSGWRVEVCRPMDSLLAELQPKRKLVLGWLAVGLALSLGLAWLGSSLAARPLVESEERYRELIDESFGLICTHDLDGTLLSINPAAARSLGVEPEAAVGRSLQDFLHPSVQDRLHPEYLARVRTEGEAEGVMHVVTAQGEERFWAYRNRLVTAGRDAPFVLGHALDVTERRNVERMLAEQALRDPLTGVGNRARFFDRLELEIDRAERDGTLLALLFLDLDDFKHINDTLGHAAGDAVLRSVAEALGEHVRKVDTVARLGGDEFAILLPAVGSGDDAVRIAEELAEAVARPVRLAMAELRPRASVGVSLYPENAHDGDALLADADRAMYRVKRSDQDRVYLSRTVPADDKRAG